MTANKANHSTVIHSMYHYATCTLILPRRAAPIRYQYLGKIQILTLLNQNCTLFHWALGRCSKTDRLILQHFTMDNPHDIGKLVGCIHWAAQNFL